MIEGRTRVANRLGMHARPAAMFVSHASRYKSEIYVEKNGLKVNGKSIMGVMMLAAEMGSELIIYVHGEDEQAALNDLIELISSGFGDLKNL